MVRSTVLLSGIVLTVGLCRFVAAAEPHLKYPRPCCPSNCPPGTGIYGYFPTTWRNWPCEDRPEVTNPHSVPAEHLPTPQGQEPVALPQPTPLGQPAPSGPGAGMQPPGAAVPQLQGPGGPAAPVALLYPVALLRRDCRDCRVSRRERNPPRRYRRADCRGCPSNPHRRRRPARQILSNGAHVRSQSAFRAQQRADEGG